MDTHTPQKRSYNMSRIKATETKPEILVRKFLFSQGFRYRKNVSNLPGKPDIVLKKYKTIIFVNGCFWHGHENCRYFRLPKSNIDFWENKISGNKKRDAEIYKKLTDSGWNCITVWDCELKKDRREETLKRLLNIIKNSIFSNK